ncbi:MAG: adenylate/guanylate cyclase domain-containing protein, partial [Gammaproteobacteria bacterium]
MSARISEWLQDLGLGQYADRFEANDIDWDLLADIDHQALKDIGIESVGHRIRILKAIGNSDRPAAEKAPSAAAPAKEIDGEDITAWRRKPGERKPVTMLFADLVGSTALTEKLDAEEAHDLLYRAAQRMCRSVENNSGTVCRFMGDGVMAMFGAPLASERHALEACRAALEMQAGIAEYAGELGSSVQIRVGLHSGEVVVLEVGDDPAKPEYDASGPTVPLAARMEQSAAAGTILITAETRALAGSAIETREHSPLEVKGFSDPVEVFELARVLSAAESAQAASARPIVGRRSELAQFRGLL